MYFAILASSLDNISNYEGGENPLVLFFLFFILTILPVLSLFYYLVSGRKKAKVNHLCRLAGFDSNEKGHFKSFLRRLHIKKPLLVLSDIRYLDAFMNRVSRYYMGRGLTEEELIREIDIFNNIRIKLNLNHTFQKRRILSSRALPPKHPVELIYTDSETNQTFRLRSQVIYNNDLYLGILPPKEAVKHSLVIQKKMDVEISFQREKGCTYSFDSRFVRSVDYPRTMWYVLHSTQLLRTDHARNLSIEAGLILCSTRESEGDNQEEITNFDEIPGLISVLNSKNCVVEISHPNFELKSNDQVLIDFELEEAPLSIRGIITQTHSKDSKQLLKIDFQSLSSEEKKHLMNFYLKEQKKVQQSIRAEKS